MRAQQWSFLISPSMAVQNSSNPRQSHQRCTRVRRMQPIVHELGCSERLGHRKDPWR